MRKTLVVLFTALALQGCFTVKVKNSASRPMDSGRTFHRWTHSLFWGIVPLGKVDAARCGPTGIHSMKTQIGGIGLLGFYVTAGIWTPMHVKITCNDARAGAPATPGTPEELADLDSEIALR